MILHKPFFVHPPPVAPSSYAHSARLETRPISSNAHISYFRSLLLEMQIYSPSIKVVKHSGLEFSHCHPVFEHQDKIEGKVLLDPMCSQGGRLTISLEGAFEYAEDHADDDYPQHLAVRRHRHVFLSSSVVIPVSSIPDTRPTIREVLSIRKRPSSSSLNLNSPAHRSYEFSFELPRGSQEMPPTVSYKNPTGDSRLEELQVAYRIITVWESSTDGSENRTLLEAPVLFEPDTGFQPLEGSDLESEPWLEILLVPERVIPFTCAVTLPTCQSFSRCNSILYFVVFSTSSGSPYLIKEIAADATIAVSLSREIAITPQRAPSPILPDTPPASDESDSQASPFIPRSRFLRRAIKTQARPRVREDTLSESKALPELPQEAFCTSRTLQTQISVGFPKRPRANDTSQKLPDGLCKGSLQLSKDMLPSVNWPGLSVKYYLDVSVLVGQDDVRVRVPIRIY